MNVNRGEWLCPDSDLSAAGIERRREAIRSAVTAELGGDRLSDVTSIRGYRAIEAWLSRVHPCAGLFTTVNKMAVLLATGSVLVDNGGPCIVTAAHALVDEDQQQHPEIKAGGLVAMSHNGQALDLSGREWFVDQNIDLAYTELTPAEATFLGGGIRLAYGPWEPRLWVAYGYPASRNRQKYLRHQFAFHANRIVLYREASAPRTFRQDASKFSFFPYNPRKSFVSDAGRVQDVRTTKGHSGGIIAGYIDEIACWMPLAAIIEMDDSPSTLIGAKLSGLFPALPDA